MKVDFIELTNFRGIQKKRITFENKNFVALIGDNGSGKTTILVLLAALVVGHPAAVAAVALLSRQQILFLHLIYRMARFHSISPPLRRATL